MSFTTNAAPIIAQLRETWSAGGTPEATHDRVTVTLTGFSRVNDMWPQPATKLVVIYKRHDQTRHETVIDVWGQQIDSWDAAEKAIEAAIDQLITAEALDQLPALGHRMRQAQAALDAATKDAAETAWRAYSHGMEQGVTRYQIAKAAGIPERTVGRWVNRPVNL